MTEQEKKKKKTKESSKQKNSISVTKDEFMRLRPVISPFVKQKTETEKDLLLILDIRELKKKKRLKGLFPTPDTKKILLDKLGKDVFHLCTGHNKVKDIVSEFKDKYKLTQTETEVAVQKYLMNLTKRNLIGFVIPKEIADKNKLDSNTVEKVFLD